MGKKKKSIFSRGRVKRSGSKTATPMQPQQDRGSQKKRPLTPEAVIKNGIAQTSQLSMHIQQLLDETFAIAPNQLKGYLLRADAEVRDLLRLLTSKIGVTPDPDVLDVDYFHEDKVVDIPPPGAVNTAVSSAAVRRGSHNAQVLALGMSSLLEDVTDIAADDADFESVCSELATTTAAFRALATKNKKAR